MKYFNALSPIGYFRNLFSVGLFQFEYYATCAVCSRTGDKELQILKKFTQVIASFSKSCSSHLQIDPAYTTIILKQLKCYVRLVCF